MTMQGGWGVDCPGVRGCNLVHIDLSGVFCHARLHRHCGVSRSFVEQSAASVGCHDSGAFSGLDLIWPWWSRGPAIKYTATFTLPIIQHNFYSIANTVSSNTICHSLKYKLNNKIM